MSEYQKTSNYTEEEKKTYRKNNDSRTKGLMSSLIVIFRQEKVSNEDIYILGELIKDRCINEALLAIGEDFSDIEWWVENSKHVIIELLCIMSLDDSGTHSAYGKLCDFLYNFSTQNEDLDETMKWLRAMTDFKAKGYDNEDEQLPTGSSARA